MISYKVYSKLDYLRIFSPISIVIWPIFSEEFFFDPIRGVKFYFSKKKGWKVIFCYNIGEFYGIIHNFNVV